MNAFVANTELKQYKMPKETGLSYRTVLRTLKPLESQGFIKLVRAEPSKKGGKESKIYALTLKGALTYLSSIAPTSVDFETNDGFHYSLEKTNELIEKKIQPYKLKDIVCFLKASGNQSDFPVFKEIDWLKDHYGVDIFRAIITAASVATARDKLPNVDGVRKIMLNDQGKSSEEAELTIKEFLSLENGVLKDNFNEAFAFQLSLLQGKGNLHNENLKRIFAKVATEIEQRKQSTLVPLKRLVESLR